MPKEGCGGFDEPFGMFALLFSINLKLLRGLFMWFSPIKMIFIESEGE